MSRKRRELSPDDRELWGRVVQTARPLKSAPLAVPEIPEPVVPPRPVLKPTRQIAQSVLRPEGSKPIAAHDLAQPLSE
ncbi:MAG: hypothetical protein JJU07_14770, partial [Natronohydrobacter sp.]|nr:hypothetical protein [Natronohydrobacter sp.]